MGRRGSWTWGSVQRSKRYRPGSAESHGMRVRSLPTGLSLYRYRQPDSRGADADGEERELDMGERGIAARGKVPRQDLLALGEHTAFQPVVSCQLEST